MIKQLKTYAKTYTPFTGGDNGIYVSRIPEPLSVQRLVDFVHEHALCRMSDKDIDELHCTIMFSPAGIVNEESKDNDLNAVPFTVAARVVRFEFWPGRDEDGYLVALLQSPALESIHKLWRLRGCIPTFEEFKPHITIQTPFDEYRELGWRLKSANNELVYNPMLIRLGDERVEDIKKQYLISTAEAISVDEVLS